MAPTTPIQKITFTQWIKHPTTAMMIFAVSAVWILLFIITDMARGSTKDCMEQVRYLRERVEKLERQVDDYTTANMIQRGVITKLADSLASKGG